MIAIGACGRWATYAAGSDTFAPGLELMPAGLIEWPLELPDVDDVAGPKVDLFGNEVIPAVGDYRIDKFGELYEHHSPETEIPALGSPGV